MKPNAFINSQWLIGATIVAALVCAVLAIVLTDRHGDPGNDLGPEFDYDIEALRQTDPALVLYKEISPRIDSEHSWGRAIAVGPEDRFYVIGGAKMHSFDASGKRLPLSIESDQELTAITVTPDGSIYLGVSDHIEIYDAGGQLQSRWESAGSQAEITSIAVTQDHVFAGEFASRTVLHYDASGQLLDSFGDFKLPSNYFDVAIDSNGLLHAANTGKHRMEAYDFTGNLSSWWGEFSSRDVELFCGCCNPISFALLPNGGGYVTCEKGLTRVKVYDAQGAFVGLVAGPEQFEQRDSLTATPDYCYNRMGLDVAVDSQGRVLVLDPALAEVRIYQKKNA